MEPNPYQSPAFSNEAVAILSAKVVVEFDLRRVRAQVRRPAILLMVMAAIGIGIDLGLLLNGLCQLPPIDVWNSDGWMPVAFVLLAYGLMAFVHLVALYGAYQMYRIRDYSHVGLALAILVIPLLSPGLVLGIPFAIWALVVMARPDVEAAFDA